MTADFTSSAQQRGWTLRRALCKASQWVFVCVRVHVCVCGGEERKVYLSRGKSLCSRVFVFVDVRLRPHVFV